MGAGPIPQDGALEEELAVLRARAYATDADIDGDPEALARLAELEEWHAEASRAHARAPSTAPPADERPGRRGSAQTTEKDATRAAGSGTDHVEVPGNGAPRHPRSSRWRAFLGGVLVATLAAIAVGGILWWAAPRPDAVLRPTSAAPDDQALGLLDFARRLLIDESTLSGFDRYRGLTVWAADSALGNRCLVIIEPSTGSLLDASCAPPGVEVIAQIDDVPIYGTDDWHEGLRSGTIARFVLAGDTVSVWLHDGERRR
jgi:hypothetical protein